MDIGAAVNAAAQVANTVTGGSQSQPGVVSANLAITDLAASTAPLTATPADVLVTASSALSILKPSTLVGQVTNVASNTLSFASNTPKILDTLRRVAGMVTDPNPDIRAKVVAARNVFRELNTLCSPLVKMAAGVDLHMVSSLLSFIPDPSGVAGIVSMVVGMLGNLDVIKLATQVGQLQENLWSIAETVAGGGDLLAIGGKFLELVPTLLGFATTALNTLTGSVAKTSPDMLGQNSSSPTMGASNVSGLLGMLTQTATSQGADDLAQLVSEGIDAATFFTSRVHEAYGSNKVDAQGRSTVQWILDWFVNRIKQVGV